MISEETDPSTHGDEDTRNEEAPELYVDASTPSKSKPDASSVVEVVDAGSATQETKSKPVADAGSVTADAGSSASSTQPPSVAQSGKPAGVFKVQDGKIFDGCGEEFIPLGINHPTIYLDRAGDAIPEIAKTGANTVRLWWYSQHDIPLRELEPALERVVENHMIPIIESHDSTCAWNMDPIIDFWIQPETVALIKKHQDHILVNIANEASYPNADEFVSKYKTAIGKMRAAGIHVPLIIDGGRCGRDYDTLLNRGKELLEFDPDHSIIFSAHLYDAKPGMSYASIFAKAKAMQIPFMVGEYANKEPPGCGGDIDYKTLISEAKKAGFGWLGWSWGNNDPNTYWNGDCALHDMTDTYAFESLRDWGKEVSVTHPASIKNSAKRTYAMTHGDTCQ